MASILKLPLLMGLFQVHHVQAPKPYYAWGNLQERHHHPAAFTTTMTPVVDKATDTKRPKVRWTPDFRLPQPMLEPWDDYYIETHRPYRVSPHYKLTKVFPNRDNAEDYGCYCTTVYRRFTLLAGCAVITSRHILTTATSTELVLRRHRKRKTLENILGFWYDVDNNWYNSSMYGTPARIHYHPLYAYPKDVNRSHPFPVMYDVAVWAATFKHSRDAVLCNRAAPHKSKMWAATLWRPSYYNIFGYQFMRAYGRRPLPWFKYTVRVPALDRVLPCPKTEWGWYHCLRTGSWAPLGLDHGSPLHRRTKGPLYDGLVGINVLSMKLRSPQMVSYFIDLNNHIVMEFLYNAYTGRLPYVYLDDRFYDSRNGAPRPRQWVRVSYPKGWQYYSKVFCCLHEYSRPGFD